MLESFHRGVFVMRKQISKSATFQTLYDYQMLCGTIQTRATDDTLGGMFVIPMKFQFMIPFGTPPGHTERGHVQLRIFPEQLRDDAEMILQPGLLQGCLTS